jgi:hypothetical protein
VMNGNVGNVFTGKSLVAEAEAARVVVVKKKRNYYRPRPVARRVVRSAIYIATLPPRCVRVRINNVSYWSCRGRYYQSYRGRYVLVYIN